MFPDPTPGLPCSVSLCLPPCRACFGSSLWLPQCFEPQASELQVWTPPYCFHSKTCPQIVTGDSLPSGEQPGPLAPLRPPPATLNQSLSCPPGQKVVLGSIPLTWNPRRDPQDPAATSASLPSYAQSGISPAIPKSVFIRLVCGSPPGLFRGELTGCWNWVMASGLAQVIQGATGT